MLPGGASGEKVVCHGVDGHPQSSVSSALHDFPRGRSLELSGGWVAWGRKNW